MSLVKKLSNFMADIGVDYAICGGHAIDMFLNKKTRPHKDLDVSIYWEDRDAVVQHMLYEGWDVYEPCGTAYLHKINDAANQKRIKTNIWCVKPTNQHYQFIEHEQDMYAVIFDNSEQVDLDYIEFLFNTRKDGMFVYERNHDVKIALDKAVFHVKDIPCLAPEMVLLYKSSAADSPDYQLDFDNAIKAMDATQLSWLKMSLSTMFPDGHKWLNAL